MQPVFGLARASLAGAALLLVFGCAQPPGSSTNSSSTTTSEKVPSYVPADRWYASERHKSGGVAASDRDSALILGCEKKDDTITLLVSPQQKLPITYAYRPVTIILDRHITYIQNWVSLSAGYSIDSRDPGFRTTIEELQKHQEVEFVLGRPATDLGAELDDRRYTLDGAKDAIETILAACGKPW